MLQTLARDDSTPRSALDVSTDTEAATYVHQLCVKPDPEVLRQTVLDILAEGGSGHLLSPEVEEYPSDEGSEVDNIDTLPMSPTRRIIIEVAQRMQPELQGPTAEELLNPTRATPATPQQSAAGSPVKPSPIPLGLAQQMSGWQMDASSNQRAHSKRTSFPTAQDPNKHAKTPNGENDKPTRRSRSTQRHRSRGGQSKSCPRQEEVKHVLIPTGYESTYHQEKQKQEKESMSQALCCHLEKQEAEKLEVLT